jgi:hypothetical protein
MTSKINTISKTCLWPLKKKTLTLAIVVVMSERFTAQAKGTTNWKSVPRRSQYIAHLINVFFHHLEMQK